MAECFGKSRIDKDESAQAAEVERRCVNMLADLWHAPGAAAGSDGQAAETAVGCSTTGSSEACMLGGMALLWRWRARRAAAGTDATAPNLVMGANVQVCWEKFCRYWQGEPRGGALGARPDALPGPPGGGPGVRATPPDVLGLGCTRSWAP